MSGTLDQLSGFAEFKTWLDERFGRLSDSIVGLKAGLSELKIDTVKLRKVLHEGDGERPLCEEVALNTEFRIQREKEKFELRKIKRAALLAFIGSLVLFALSLCINGAVWRIASNLPAP